MTQMQQTSLFAYDELLRSGTINQKERDVLVVISNQPLCTDREIADCLGWQINRITGRRNALAKKGIIVPDGVKKYRTYRMAIAWRLRKNTDAIEVDTSLQDRIKSACLNWGYSVEEFAEASRQLAKIL